MSLTTSTSLRHLMFINNTSIIVPALGKSVLCVSVSTQAHPSPRQCGSAPLGPQETHNTRGLPPQGCVAYTSHSSS